MLIMMMKKPTMTNNPRKVLIALLGILFFGVIIIFAYSRIAPRLRGPELTEVSLSPYDSFEDASIELTGTVQHANSIEINGRKTSLDKENRFRETVVLSPGYTIIELVLFDNFGNNQSYKYPVYSRAAQGIPKKEEVEIIEQEVVLEGELLEEETNTN